MRTASAFSSAAAAAAPRAETESAARSSAAAVSSSGPSAASARCRACSSGVLRRSATRLWARRRRAAGADSYTADASRGCVKRILAPGDLDDAGTFRGLQRIDVDERGRRTGENGGCEERLQSRLGEGVKPGPRERLRLAGHRQRCPCRCAGPLELPGDLERVERVAAADRGDPNQNGPRERMPEPCFEHAVQGGNGESVDLQLLDAAGRNRPFERGGPVGLGADGDEHADRSILEPANRVLERRRGRAIEPLRVVDRHQHRLGRDDPEHGEQSGRDDVPVEAPGSRVLAEEGDVERSPLDVGKLVVDAVRDAVQQVPRAPRTRASPRLRSALPSGRSDRAARPGRLLPATTSSSRSRQARRSRAREGPPALRRGRNRRARAPSRARPAPRPARQQPARGRVVS